MALIKCPECGKEVSDTCERCIHCGYVFNPSKRNMINDTMSNRAEKIAIRNNREKNLSGLIISLIFTLGGGIVALLCLANRARFVGVVDTSQLDMYLIISSLTFAFGLFGLIFNIVRLSKD